MCVNAAGQETQEKGGIYPPLPFHYLILEIPKMTRLVVFSFSNDNDDESSRQSIQDLYVVVSFSLRML